MLVGSAWLCNSIKQGKKVQWPLRLGFFGVSRFAMLQGGFPLQTSIAVISGDCTAGTYLGAVLGYDRVC